MQWIDADEQLPPVESNGCSKPVLVYVFTWRGDKWFEIGWYDSIARAWFSMDDDITRCIDVSHWAALGEPPTIRQEKLDSARQPGDPEPESTL